MIRKCEYCGKVLREDPITFFSGSKTGNSIVIYLCSRCGKNELIQKRIMAKNDKALDEMDRRQGFLSYHSATKEREDKDRSSSYPDVDEND